MAKLLHKLYHRWGIWASYYQKEFLPSGLGFPASDDDYLVREKFVGSGLPFKFMTRLTIRELQRDADLQLLFHSSNIRITWEPRRLK